MGAIQIGQRRIGDDEPCFVIAEAGVNHDGDVETALRLIDAAVDAGADAVKFQTFVADSLVSASAPKAAYQVETTGSESSQLEMLSRLELSADAFRRLRDHCLERGTIFLSTPFEDRSLDLLVELGVPALKVGSGEITNLPFLRRIAETGLPVVLSTGMSTLDEVRAACAALGAPDAELAVLHCVSRYPAPPETINLRAMATLRRELSHPVGLSDHTIGRDIGVAAVALGAVALEKHLTLDTSRAGPDHRASLDPPQLAEYVRAVRDVEAAMGDGTKRPAPGEAEVAAVARKSVVVTTDLDAGHVLTASDLAIRRPGTGLAPDEIGRLPGRALTRSLRAGDVVDADAVR